MRLCKVLIRLDFPLQIAFFDMVSGSTNDFILPSLSRVFGFAYSVGAKIHSDSWGADYNGPDEDTRSLDSYAYDNQDFLILVAAGNSGPTMARMLNPGT